MIIFNGIILEILTILEYSQTSHLVCCDYGMVHYLDDGF